MFRGGAAIAATLAAAAALAACGEADQAADRNAPVAFARLSPDPVKHGERVSQVLGCSGCHNKELTGNDWSDELGRLWSANLTVAAAEYDDLQMKAMIVGGKRPDGTPLWNMPSHLFTQLADTDLDAVLAFIRSRPKKGEAHPLPTFGPVLKAQIAKGELNSADVEVARDGKLWPPDMGETHRLARYMVRATCAECHQMTLRGGTPYPGAEPRPDIRIAASYDIKDFQRLLRTGIAPGERKLGLMGEVARGRYSHFTDAEIAAIHAYLKEVAARDP